MVSPWEGPTKNREHRGLNRAPTLNVIQKQPQVGGCKLPGLRVYGVGFSVSGIALKSLSPEINSFGFGAKKGLGASKGLGFRFRVLDPRRAV